MPGRFIDTDMARKIMDEYLNTPFEGGRHQARVDSIPVHCSSRQSVPQQAPPQSL
jgi:ribose 5-phosphate isomerase RpiB